MIRIHIKNREEYQSIQSYFLEGITDFVEFDIEDFLTPEELTEKYERENFAKKEKTPVKETQGSKSKERKSKKTEEMLLKDFPRLHDFLYDNEKVNRNNLRLLLAGPESPPESFFGGNSKYKTMKAVFDEIRMACGYPDDKESAIAACKLIFRYNKPTKSDGIKTTSFAQDQKFAYSLIRKLHVEVCPYCNRIYTKTLPSQEETSEGKIFRTTRAEIDHYYPRSEFPYLGLSLFNMIPSCHICNSNKGVKKDVVYPYDEDFGNKVKFKLVPEIKEGGNTLGFFRGESDNFRVKLQLSEQELEQEYIQRVQKSKEQFRLEELYNEHKSEIQDILRNAYYFNEEYINTAVIPLIIKIRSKLKKAKLDKVGLQEEARNILFFNRLRQSEWEMRPLAKLTADICDWIDENK